MPSDKVASFQPRQHPDRLSLCLCDLVPAVFTFKFLENEIYTHCPANWTDCRIFDFTVHTLRLPEFYLPADLDGSFHFCDFLAAIFLKVHKTD